MQMRKITQALVKWSPSGFFSAATIHFLWNHEWTQAAIATFITACSSLWVKFSGKFMETLEAEAEKKGEAAAKALIRTVDNLQSNISEHQLNLDFQDEYYQQLVYTCRDYLTQGLDKDRILKLQKVFVPLKIVSTEVMKVNPRMIQPIGKASKQERQIWHFLAAMEKYPAFRRMAVLGAPGSGKTTLLRHLMLTYATKSERTVHPKAPKLIPILIYLRDWRQVIAEKKPPLAELVEKQLKQQRTIAPLNPPDNWFAERLHQNQCLVMLDGLDEVADETQRRQVRDWVDEQMQAYPDTPFILTSRLFGYKSAPLQQAVMVLEVQSFNLKQMKQFIRKWYLQTEIVSRAGEDDRGVREEAKQQAEDLVNRICNSRPLAALAVNPLLLTMIATVHRRGSALPGKRVELYKEVCQVLLERRQRAKQIDDPLTATQKQSVLQILALGLMRDKTREFELSEGVSFIRGKLAKVANRKARAEEFLKQVKDVCGLLVEKELGVYEFAHKSFQEYLAAVQVKESHQEQLLIKNISNSWWFETIRLYAAQSDATNLIRAALEKDTVDTLALAYDCLEEGFSVDAEVREQLEARLEEDLEDR